MQDDCYPNRESTGDPVESGAGNRVERGSGDWVERLRLRHRVTALPDGTVRCTVYPEGMHGVVPLSAWLSVDDDATVRLDEMR